MPAASRSSGIIGSLVEEGQRDPAELIGVWVYSGARPGTSLNPRPSLLESLLVPALCPQEPACGESRTQAHGK